ncbi:GNAT family N-acetyltransferase [Methylocystis sp. WRRC1]|uniref:GNAT family N-acetyltransferase n=1 Tax=unclassified Methylocystis TaxID=2625913 RepID=UPI001D13BA91|nr:MULTISPECIES: GNAT family N-acetyltransferase [unclassified Methylocystis]MCC3247194.1 GNAT family N-acetyltransferase [Methylocystis sp. WRRC1]
MSQAPPMRIRCRLIAEADTPGLAELLSRGFPDRSIAYWARALDTLARRDAPDGYPRFGYLLEHDGSPVGVILMIFTKIGSGPIRCNISSWYVEEAHRGYASLLIAAAVRHREVTYINTSPAVHTWPIIEAQGFRRYCNGQMLTIPALSPWRPNARARRFENRRDYGDSLSIQERDLLSSHVKHGCLALVVRERRDAHPFVFLPRRVLKNVLPTLQLIYCRDISDFQRFAGPLGRELMRHGHPTVLIDASEPLPGVVGKYMHNRGPKYFKGPERPRLGDLAFSESVLFGP